MVYSKASHLDSFEAYFDVVEANEPELLEQVFRLRYQVYCVENHFEDPDMHRLKREMDLYDAHCRHIGLIYRPRNELVGAARLIVLARSKALALPIEGVLDSYARAQLKRYPAHQIGEISRYAVSKRFRCRKGEHEIADVGWDPYRDQDSRRLMPHLTLGLMRGILALSMSSEVRFLCACMRPALLRLLKQLGLEFRPIGDLVDYHGLRQPCIAERDALLEGLKRQCGEYFNVVAQPVTDPAASDRPVERPGTSCLPSSTCSADVHCRRVRTWAAELARVLEIPPSESVVIERVALAHHGPDISRDGASIPDLLQKARLGGFGGDTGRLASVLEMAHAVDDWFDSEPIRFLHPEFQLDPSIEKALALLKVRNRADVQSIIDSTPVFPAVAQRALRLLASDDCSATDIEALISNDQVLAAQVVGAANSALSGGNHPITSIRHAVGRIGTDAAARIIVASAMRPLFVSATLKQLWEHSLRAACMAEALARLAAGISPAEAFLAALVHDVGRLAMTLFPSEFHERYRRLVDNGCPVTSVEQVLCSFTHAQASSAVLTAWRFPAEMIEGVKFHHRPEQTESKLAALLYATEDLADSREDFPSTLRRENALNRLSLRPEQLAQSHFRVPSVMLSLISAA